jgi:hypothetical protein
MKAKYAHLIETGKPAKVALTAIMRKLVVLANATGLGLDLMRSDSILQESRASRANPPARIFPATGQSQRRESAVPASPLAMKILVHQGSLTRLENRAFFLLTVKPLTK